MKKVGPVLALLSISALTVMPSPWAQAASFNNASVKGSYSFLINLRTANASTNQFAMVGVLTFNGAGSVKGSYTSISSDTVQTGNLGGTYSVASNGTGTMKFTTGSTAQFAITINSTVAGLAHGLQLLQTNDDNNQIASGTAILQATTAETYSTASLQGNFAFQYNPWTVELALAEDGGIGVWSFDGKGTVTSAESIMYDGKLLKGSDSFHYTVNPDGTGTIAPPTGGKGPHFAFALNTATGTQAAALQFLDTNTSDGPGDLVITGAALKQ